MTVILDAHRMQDRRAAHRYLKRELAPYSGENLDALYDALTTLTDAQVAFENVPASGYFQRVLRVFQDAAAQNPGLILL